MKLCWLLFSITCKLISLALITFMFTLSLYLVCTIWVLFRLPIKFIIFLRHLNIFWFGLQVIHSVALNTCPRKIPVYLRLIATWQRLVGRLTLTTDFRKSLAKHRSGRPTLPFINVIYTNALIEIIKKRLKSKKPF